MKHVFLALFWVFGTFLAFAPVSLAQGPDPTPTTAPGPKDTGMVFKALPIDTEAENVFSFGDMFAKPEFFAEVGSIALTVFALLDALELFPTLVIIFLSVGIIGWLYGFVTNDPGAPYAVDATQAVNEATRGAYQGRVVNRLSEDFNEGLINMDEAKSIYLQVDEERQQFVRDSANRARGAGWGGIVISPDLRGRSKRGEKGRSKRGERGRSRRRGRR